jgi:hypothetical protein
MRESDAVRVTWKKYDGRDEQDPNEIGKMERKTAC